MTESKKQELFKSGVIAIIAPKSLVSFRKEPNERAKERLAKRFAIEFDKVETVCGRKYYHIKDDD